METPRGQTCCVCLCTERKIKILKDNNKKECFLRLILETTACPNNISVSLCWECDALFKRFIKFKMQAQRSYITLQEYTEMTVLPTLKASLEVIKQYAINLVPSENSSDITHSDIVKVEGTDTTDVKEEYNNDTNDVSEDVNFSEDDDDKTLIELCSKESISNAKKKHRKKEKAVQNSEVKTAEEYIEKDLTDQEIEEERRCLRLREDYVNAVFRCEKCILSFPNADDLKDHISLKHELHASSWKCAWCECTFPSQVSFNYHCGKHARRYECVACAETLANKRAAIRHYANTHLTRADLEYDDVHDRNLKTELTQDTSNSAPRFPCEFCDKTFRWKTSLRKHVETHRIESGQKRRPYCEPCRLSFTTTSNLQKHVKTSSKHQIQLKLRKLKEESQPPDASSLEKHQAKIEQIRSSVNSTKQLYPCAQCDRKFQWRGNLLRHLHSHAAKANGELVCAPCNRSFSSIATYKQHLKISRKHVSEEDFSYMCSDCGKRFANRTRLKDHVDWEHLKNYVHKCPVCQKVFKSHTSLYLHKQVVHKKDNADHLCDHCGKPFPNRAKLRSHIVALHTSEAPYACSACNARFSWHSCLSRHVRRVHRAKAADKE